MVYNVKVLNRRDAADPHIKFTESFFVERQSKPHIGSVRRLVEKIIAEDFVEETIEILECPDLDAEQLRKDKIDVYKLD